MGTKKKRKRTKMQRQPTFEGGAGADGLDADGHGGAGRDAGAQRRHGERRRRRARTAVGRVRRHQRGARLLRCPAAVAWSVDSDDSHHFVFRFFNQLLHHVNDALRRLIVPCFLCVLPRLTGFDLVLLGVHLVLLDFT